MKKIVLLLIFYPLVLIAQDNISELEKKLETVSGIQKVDVLNNLANSFLYDDTEKSMSYAQQALELAQEEDYILGQAFAHENLGNNFESLHDYQQAVTHFIAARDAYILANRPASIANILNYIGIVYDNMNEYPTAIGYYKQSFDQYKELQDTLGMAMIVNNMGGVYDVLGKYDKALYYYLLNMQYNKVINNDDGVASSMNNIGNVYQALKDYDKALNYLQQAKQMYKALDDTTGIAMTVHNIGIIYHDQGKYDKALEAYLSSMQSDLKRNDKVGLAASYNNIAIVYDEMNKLEASKEYYMKSLTLSEEVQDRYSIANTSNNMGFLFLKMGNNDKALEYFERGLEIAEELNALELIKESYDGLQQYYYKKGKLEDCLEYYKRYEDIEDSIFSQNTKKEIAKLQMQYDLDSKQQEIDLLQKDNEIKLLQLNRQKNIRNFFFAGLLFLIFLVLLVYYAYVIKKRMTESLLKEIEERNKIEQQLKQSLKEKDVMLREIHHRVKNNMQIISSLLSLQTKYIKDKDALQVFRNSQDRIRSMALVHEKLYQSEDFSSINFAEYIRELIDNIHLPERHNIKITLDLEDVIIDINKAIPCGLIVNELITNAFKHAFPDNQDGEIKISMHLGGDNAYTLIMSDNGNGLPESFDWNETSSLGLQLVSGLVRQLQGNIDVVSEGGTKFTIIFK
ncbi:MAG TPA: tetratricopeptide repeat protein [Candidatus Cloacimonetes bacterium]|nr:tetratricopeptide repeat protein [Candidatus Cloacimonadota bacterium]HEX38001.1 tetratricopeptide repeat protein [Candidatus Cloacimonadota bacterium]